MLKEPFLKKGKLSKIRVGVLRGGPSGEYDVSLKTGGSILENLPEKYHGLDIFIDKKGKWHFNGVIFQPEKILSHIDVIFNGLHGQYGEDGTVQRLLEHFHVPYTGSNSFSSALAMNKIFSRNIFEKENIKVPKAQTLKKDDLNYLKIFEIFQSLPKPIVSKPSTAGSSLGISINDNLEKFTESLDEAFKHSPSVLMEEYITGTEATCAIVEGASFNYALPPVEIRTKNHFFDYDAKYSGQSEEICPGNFSELVTRRIQDTALAVHKSLGLRHYSRTDMIVTENGDIYVLEVNTLPGLTEESLFPKALKASGSDLSEFIDHVLHLALNKK